jgi:hypothetical protein
MICQDRPKRSSIQPQAVPLPPPARIRSQSVSTSAWDSQDTNNEMAGVNLNWGAPLSAMKVWPASSKTMFRMLPSGAGPPLP